MREKSRDLCPRKKLPGGDFQSASLAEKAEPVRFVECRSRQRVSTIWVNFVKCDYGCRPPISLIRELAIATAEAALSSRFSTIDL